MDAMISTPRAAVFQDISGVGRCALTVAIPALAVMNVQPCPVPTAALSAHTAFPSVAACDLTDFMERAIRHWQDQAFPFDAVMSGYLANERQAALIGGFIDSLRAAGRPYVLVDPAMADEGRLYGGLKDAMPAAMETLCAKADIITPNRTEAAFLTGEEWSDAPLSEERAASLLRKLLSLGCGCALITGAQIAGGKMANLCMRKGEGEYHRVAFARLDTTFPGTGDLFAAVLLGALMRGETEKAAMARATAFTYRAIERTMRLNTPPREGVQFEAMLCQLPSMEGFAVETIRI